MGGLLFVARPTIIFLVESFKRLEKFVEQLIEQPFSRLFKPGLHPADLTKALAAAMESARAEDGTAPAGYRILLNEADFQALARRSDIAAETEAVKRYLTALMAEARCAAPAPLQVSVSAGADVPAGQIRVVTGPAEGADTRQMPQAAAGEWVLRLPDGQIIPLRMPVVRLGRSSCNDVALAEETVSRYHAQLRRQNGLYYAQNLSRNQPLWLNDAPLTAPTPLKAGDRLKLGRVIIEIEHRPA